MEMNNSSSMTIASIENFEEYIIDVNENLAPHPECCIYRVPKVLRKTNEEAYTPKVLSIGPLHHGRDECADMEKQKIRYRREFGKRITSDIWGNFIKFIEEKEQRIRNCYAEGFKIQKQQFVKLILYDAVFIIELFLRDFDQERDYLIDIARIRVDIYSDLQLLENQLPFFVLDGLYTLAFPGSTDANPSFFKISCLFFRFCESDKIPIVVEGQHFTDMSRYFMTKNFQKPESPPGYFADLPCAVKLQASGVNFNGIESECLLDMKFVKKKRWILIPGLQVVELQIPKIQVHGLTECELRNMMALEQCHYPQETLVCNYIDIMDMLIDTEEDVNLLVEAGIISNNLGDGATVANMFNKLGQKVSFSPSHYSDDIFQNLRAHYDNPWNHVKATLKRVYFNNLWRGTGTVAAGMLLLLTLIQTIFSVKSGV